MMPPRNLMLASLWILFVCLTARAEPLPLPPSSCARHSSSAVRLGFAYRE